MAQFRWQQKASAVRKCGLCGLSSRGSLCHTSDYSADTGLQECCCRLLLSWSDNNGYPYRRREEKSSLWSFLLTLHILEYDLEYQNKKQIQMKICSKIRCSPLAPPLLRFFKRRDLYLQNGVISCILILHEVVWYQGAFSKITVTFFQLTFLFQNDDPTILEHSLQIPKTKTTWP